MDVILSTRNPSKVVQIQELFSGSSINLKMLDEVGIEGEVIEDGETLEENAFKKADFAHNHSNGLWVMADDTGLYINGLDGAPGIHAARWAGDVSTEEITWYTIGKLQDISDRSAIFRTAVVVISPAGNTHVFKGDVSGKILETPRTRPQPMMPYSPIFVPVGETKCWAEMDTEHENRISHRGMAFRQVRAFLEKII